MRATFNVLVFPYRATAAGDFACVYGGENLSMVGKTLIESVLEVT